MNKKPKINRSTKDDITVTEIPAACCDDLAAVEFLERHRWGGQAGCPHCGDTDVYPMQAAGGGREKYYRWRCRGCKQQFSVRTGAVFEDSRVTLRHRSRFEERDMESGLALVDERQVDAPDHDAGGGGVDLGLTLAEGVGHGVMGGSVAVEGWG